MAKTVALFGGQGAQYPGMGKDLYDNFAQVRQIYQCAGDIFGWDVAAVSFSGTPEELAQTQNAQSALFTLQVAAYTAALEELPPPQAVAGHSLGEYAALYCAGAYGLEDGMRILAARMDCMSRAAAENPGTMYAVIGKAAVDIEAACTSVEGEVWPVNYNLPTQTVIAGRLEPCAKAAALLEEQGAKVVQLKVQGAFHTALMAGAAEEFQQRVQGIQFSPTTLDFYANTTGGRLQVEDYPRYLAQHMVSPVRFVQEIAALSADGVDTCVEFGPKNAVTLAKKNNRALTVLHVEDPATLHKAAESLK